MNVEYPQFRKLINGKSYYHIESAESMHEIQLLGKSWQEHHLKAKILPERLHISDVLDGVGGTYIVITKGEYEDFQRHCQDKLNRF